jgi:hypothetical protein
MEKTGGKRVQNQRVVERDRQTNKQTDKQRERERERERERRFKEV